MGPEYSPPPDVNSEPYIRALKQTPIVWNVPEGDTRFFLADTHQDPEPEKDPFDGRETGLIFGGLGALVTIMGVSSRDRRLASRGIILMAMGGTAYGVSHFRNIEIQAQTTEVIQVEATPSPYLLPTVSQQPFSVQISPIPTETPTFFPSETPTQTFTPTPSETPTVTPVPQMIPFSLPDALQYCADPSNPLELKKMAIMRQIGADFANVECRDLGFEPGSPITVDVSVDKEGWDYSSHSFSGVYVPYQLLANQSYLITVENCDDQCTISLRDAGDVVVDYEIETDITTGQKQFVVRNEGHTFGYLHIQLKDIGGGSGVTVRLEPFSP